ncbi:AAA family ATPase [Vescimonas sp.]|uniref:ATP-binding protein n=1 Tax=Vescimonas sp. TaxID=2892404 RepID=UPI003078B807
MQLLHANATYGKLDQAQLDLQPGLNVICAPNEGGKSTWCRFLLAMFYGLNTRQRGDLADKNRFQPWSGSLMQGKLELSVGDKELTLSRRTQRPDAPLGVFSCTYSGTDTPVPGLDAARCGETLLGAPQSVYQRCAFIPSGSLAIDADADLERRISALISTGDEKISFSQVESRLKKQLRQRKYNRSGSIPLLEAEIAGLRAAQQEAQTLTGQLENLQQQLSQAREDQARRRQARLQVAQEALREKERCLQALPDSSDLQRINQQLGAVRSLGDQVQQAQEAVSRQESAIEDQLQELNRNPLHPMTKAQLEAQLQIQPPAPPQVAQLLISLALGLCGGGFLWYEIDRPQVLWLCLACAVTALAAGNFLRLLIRRIRLQQSRRRELSRQEELRKLAESYLPALEELEAQRALLRQKQQILSDGDRRLRTQLSDLLSQVSRWDDSVQSAGDIRRFVRETAQNRDRLAQELHQAQTQLLQAQMSDADDTVTHLQQQIAQVQGRLDAGRDAQALGDQISRLEEELIRQQAEYDALRLSLDALQAANTTLQNRFSPELGRRAAEIFADMTGSTWSHILLDREFHLSAESGSDPTRRSVQLLSAGTADQLYLAVRLAICEMILPPEQNPPLILDDALLTFDDARLSTTLDYLTRLGAQRQILLFTCQGREAALLQGRPGVHITSLT